MPRLIVLSPELERAAERARESEAASFEHCIRQKTTVIKYGPGHCMQVAVPNPNSANRYKQPLVWVSAEHWRALCRV